jgi:DNA-binding phage protein
MNREKLLKNTGSFDDYMMESLSDSEYAKIYLMVALQDYHEDGDAEAFFDALSDVLEAQSGMTPEFAQSIPRQSLKAA